MDVTPDKAEPGRNCTEPVGTMEEPEDIETKMTKPFPLFSFIGLMGRVHILGSQYITPIDTCSESAFDTCWEPWIQFQNQQFTGPGVLHGVEICETNPMQVFQDLMAHPDNLVVPC